MKTDKTRIIWRHTGGVVLTMLFALSLMAGLFLLVRLQARAQVGPESIEAELSVDKRANTAIAAPGDTLTYSINIGSDLAESHLWLTDTLPPGLTLITESLGFSGKGAYGWTGDTVTWTSSNFGLGNFAIITFSAEISSEMEGEVVNTAQVTGAGELITDAWSTTVVSGRLHSQIRSPNKNTHISEKGTRTIEGIAWREGAEVPYMTEDVALSLEQVPGNDWSYWVRWNEVPSAASYLLQESTDPNFDTLTDNMAPAGMSKLIAKTSQEAGTYYYRMQAIHGSGDVTPTRWSNVVSATVPWTGAALSASASAAGSEVEDAAEVLVQVRTGEADSIESKDWYSAEVTGADWDGWTWSYEWTLPEADVTQYVIQSRASDDGETFGPVDTVTVTLDNQTYFAYLPLMFRNWPPTPDLNPIPAPDAGRSYRVSWQGVEKPIDHYTLQQARFADFSVVDQSWDTAQTSRQIQDAYCAYYYRVRADNASRWGDGPWSNVEQGQASPPDAPTLNAIEDPENDNVYSVSWSPVSVGVAGVAVDRYVLQESKDADFNTITRQWLTTSTSRQVENDEFDTFYYRVRADDLDCWGHGPWSDARSITTAWSYFDDFSDVDSGWPSLVDDERWAFYEVDSSPPTPGDGSPYPRDGNGYFIARRSGGEPFARFGPGVAVPSNDYELEVDTRWWDARWYATYQILFGGNESLSEYYAVRVMIDDIEHLCKFSLVKHSNSGTRVLNDGWRDVEDIYCGERREGGDASWNHWKIRREGDWIEVHVNGKYLGEWKDGSYGANRYFGVRSTLYEGFTPSKPEYDNWSVKLLD